jgi:hypothetical protein
VADGVGASFCLLAGLDAKTSVGDIILFGGGGDDEVDGGRMSFVVDGGGDGSRREWGSQMFCFWCELFSLQRQTSKPEPTTRQTYIPAGYIGTLSPSYERSRTRNTRIEN